MPELPEVEIAARRLSEWLVGKRVAEVRVASTRVVRGSSARAVERSLLGRRVTAVERRGKWLRLGLDDGAALFSHLGMTGKWVRRAPGQPAERAERARIEVAGASVRYHDQRLFGRLVPSPDGAPIEEWQALGRDPLRDGLDAEWLAAALAGRRGPIKQVLLDQTVIAGVGNIQAIEALWRARLHPTRAAATLRGPELRRLVDAILGSIADTLRAEEASAEIVYVEEDADANPFAVYGRAGTPCPRCQAPLERLVLGGRGTVLCPRCQKQA